MSADSYRGTRWGTLITLTPRQIAAYNHARCHDLSRPIDKCWRCKWILWREARRA